MTQKYVTASPFLFCVIWLFYEKKSDERKWKWRNYGIFCTLQTHMYHNKVNSLRILL